MAICNDRVAMKAGTNAGIIANLLMGLMEEGDAVEKFGKTWCRCSFKSITVIYPFLSMAQVEYAIGLLRDKEIIISRKLSFGGFDHTNWYAFTEYGRKIMKWGDEHKGYC
ncbi:hypothetical protein [Anaerofustis butyriciformans]|uniref:hypothetical protein n=1 Tax=Anaerofustis butyriciformans TaxID=3108533 RepID=UPI003F88EFAD